MSAITMTIGVEMVFGSTDGICTMVGLGNDADDGFLLRYTDCIDSWYQLHLVIRVVKEVLIPWQHENRPAKKALIPKYNCNQWFCDGFPRLAEVGREPSACFTR
jgi:hypothetical protein